MHSDGAVLPDLAETVVLHRLGLVRSDDFPDLAARWLAADLIDSDAVRMLAAHHPNDPWMLEELLATAVVEANLQPPSTPAEVQRIAVDWITSTWRTTRDTRWAVATLARLGETHLEFDLGLFVGLDDEWNGSWGRLEPDLRAAASEELDRLTHHNPGRTDQSEALAFLDGANNEGYGPTRVPSKRDEEISAVVRQIDGPDAFVRTRDALDEGHGRVLSAFAERMASLAVRTGSRRTLRDGLMAAQLALAVVGDARDSLPALSLLFRAGELIGLKPKVEFADVAALAPPPDNQPLLKFRKRNKRDRSITAMAYIEDRDDDGFRFKRTW